MKQTLIVNSHKIMQRIIQAIVSLCLRARSLIFCLSREWLNQYRWFKLYLTKNGRENLCVLKEWCQIFCYGGHSD